MPEFNVSDGFMQTLAKFSDGEFSTADFILCYKDDHATEWSNLEVQFGVGGKGAGQHHTVFTRIAHALSKLARAGEIQKLEYRVAPDWWGNAEIQYWASNQSGNAKSKSENAVDEEYREGSHKLKIHLVRERARGLSKKKKDVFRAEHGKLFCENCKLVPAEDFGSVFGESVIEVHHALVTVGSMSDDHRTKLSDLECLCANCHRLTHAKMNHNIK